MEAIFNELVRAVHAGRRFVDTALIETRGSTPQKAGARMLVFEDGTQQGTLGGGCIEAEVRRRALGILNEGSREILTFQLDNDYGWDDGLICGGRMQMLVDPVRPGEDNTYFDKLNELVQSRRGFTESILINPDKAGGGLAGDRQLWDDQGRFQISRTGELPSTTVQRELRSVADRPRPYLAVGVSYLPQLERCRLIIVGCGHVGQSVAKLASQVEFDIWGVDDREEYCSHERFPEAQQLIVGDIKQTLQDLEIDANTYCIIVTRGHHHDEEAQFHLADRGARYVGMIGSRRKIKLIFEDLLREGISREALADVYAPLGIDIGSQTVPEISVSIVAELVAHRNLGALPTGYRRGSLMGDIAHKANRSVTETPGEATPQA